MKYKVFDDRIEIYGHDDFNPEHILECGQIFSYKKSGQLYKVYSQDKKAVIFQKNDGFVIQTKAPEYFENFFDLKTDYSKIKQKLLEFPILQGPIGFGYGIRILKQNLFEAMIGFIISANNNIKRIQLILGRIKENFGTKRDGFYAFPTREQLLRATQDDFARLGAGYRAKYLFQVLRQVDEQTLQSWQTLKTPQLRQKLISLAGIGPKVADCVLLFGYGRGDVFPVDTWIEKMFLKFYDTQALKQMSPKNLNQTANSALAQNALMKSNPKADQNSSTTPQNNSTLIKNNSAHSQNNSTGAENYSTFTEFNSTTAQNNLTVGQNNSTTTQNNLAISQPTPAINREKIREFLTNEFGLLSGFAQQYLFYYMRLGS